MWSRLGRRTALVFIARAMIVLTVVVVLTLPWLRGWHDMWLLRLVDDALSLQCHRIPDRTWRFGGVYMAVCSRCTGFYLGFGLGIALKRPRWRFRHVMIWTVCAMVLMVLEALAERVGVVGIWHPVRTATGVAVTWPVASLAFRRLSAWGTRTKRHRWS